MAARKISIDILQRLRITVHDKPTLRRVMQSVLQSLKTKGGQFVMSDDGYPVKSVVASRH